MDYSINAQRHPQQNETKTVSEALGTSTNPPQNTGVEAPEKSPEKPRSSTLGGSGTSILSQIAEQNARTESASNAAFRSLSTLKTVTAVLGGLVHHTKSMSPDQVNEESRRVLAHYGEQSMKLHQLLGTPTERYVLESITGSVSSLISEHFRVAGPAALEVDWATKLFDGCQIDGIFEQPKGNHDWASPEARRSLAMMNAIWPVISAIQKNSLFHSDTDALIQRLSDKIWMMVDETLEGNSVVQEMPDTEQDMLRKNLLMRAGQLLSDCWLSGIRESLLEIREMDTEERRQVVANGYPLDRIESEFDQQYALLKKSFEIALSINYNHGHSPDNSSGPKLG